MKRKWAIAVVLLAGAAATAGYLEYLRRFSAAKQASVTPTTAQGDSANELSLPGQIQAIAVTKIPVPMEGQIVAFHAEVGDEVYEGQLLAEVRSQGLDSAQQAAVADLERGSEKVNELDSAIAAARLEASRSQADATRVRGELERASRNYTRQKLLLAEGATPRREFDRAAKEFESLGAESKTLDEVAKQAADRASNLQAELDSARKQLDEKSLDLESAKARVDSGQIISPVSGIVAARRGASGDEVHPAMDDLFRIATDLSKLVVIVEPPPPAVARIRPGLEALITSADVPGEALSGVVRGTEQGKVTIEFANPSPLIKPGHTAQVRITIP